MGDHALLHQQLVARREYPEHDVVIIPEIIHVAFKVQVVETYE